MCIRDSPTGAGDLAIELTAEQAAAVAASGLSIGSYNVTITKITYSVTTVTTDPQPTGTKEITLSEEEREFGANDYDSKKYIFKNDLFKTNKPAVGGNITVTVKEPGNSWEAVAFISNGWNNITNYTEVDGAYIYQYPITEGISNNLMNSGLEVLTYNKTITKITYTATVGGTGADDPTPDVPSDKEVRTVELDPAISLVNWQMYTVNANLLPDITTGRCV